MNRRREHEARIHRDLLRWFMQGEVGLSSSTMAFVLGGIGESKRGDYPLDPDDLRRCVKLLDAVPALRRRLRRLRRVSLIWAGLVDDWAELTRLLREEMAEGTGRAPRTYARMKQIRGIR